MAAVVAVGLGTVVALGRLGVAVDRRARADAVADLVALAGALAGAPAAADVAAANGAAVTSVRGAWPSPVVVEVELDGTSATAAATAG